MKWTLVYESTKDTKGTGSRNKTLETYPTKQRIQKGYEFRLP